jgi:hypothetical protein
MEISDNEKFPGEKAAQEVEPQTVNLFNPLDR